MNRQELFTIVPKLVDLLSLKRSQKRSTWLQVARCLRRLDVWHLPLLVTFSQQSGLVTEAECHTWWETQRNIDTDNYPSYSSLFLWARHDNPNQYYDLLSWDVDYSQTLGADWEMAKVLYLFYGDMYRYENQKWWSSLGAVI